MLCIRLESKFFYIRMHVAHWFLCEFQEHVESLYIQMSGVGQRFPKIGPCVFAWTHPILKKLSYRFKIARSGAPSSLETLEDGEQWFYVLSHNNNVLGWEAAAPFRRDLSFSGWGTFDHFLCLWHWGWVTVVSHHTSTVRLIYFSSFRPWKYSSAAYVSVHHGVTHANTTTCFKKSGKCVSSGKCKIVHMFNRQTLPCFTPISIWFLQAFESF